MRLAVHMVKTRSAAKAHVRKAGTTREVARASQRSGGITSRFFASIDSGASSGIGVSPSSVSGAVSSSSAASVTSRVATVTVSGGVAPFTYAWSQVSGDSMVATNASGASTAFTASVMPGANLASVWICTVTDAAGTSADSPNVNAGLRNLGGTL